VEAFLILQASRASRTQRPPKRRRFSPVTPLWREWEDKWLSEFECRPIYDPNNLEGEFFARYLGLTYRLTVIRWLYVPME